MNVKFGCDFFFWNKNKGLVLYYCVKVLFDYIFWLLKKF